MIHFTSPKSGLTHRLGLFGMVLPMTLPLAAQSTWNGGTNTNWSTAANWGSGIPAAGASIVVADTTTNNLTLDGATPRSVGNIMIGSTATRTSAFTLLTNTNTLTISGGITANGNFTTAPNTAPVTGIRVRGNIVVSADQTWLVGGQPGTVTDDRGLFVQDIASGTPGTLALNANVIKSGTGQLSIAGTTVSGVGNLTVNEGTLKLNGGSSTVLNATGTGKFILNNSATVFFSKNSGTYGAFSRAFQFNNTTNVVAGGTSTAGPWDIGSNMEWTGLHTITVNNSVGAGTPAMTYQFSGVMSGTGMVTKSGASPLTLAGSGSNTLSGLVAVTAGELGLSKTSSATAIAGNLAISGGIVRMNQPNQIADTASVTVSGTGQFLNTTGHADTIAALSISSTANSSISGLTVTGATTISNGTQDLNSGLNFTTNSLALSNNAAFRFIGAHTTGTSAANVGSGGLTLDTGRVVYGNPGSTGTSQFNLSGGVVSTGTSSFTPTNYDGPRVIDLQAGSRSFAVNSGSLDIRTTVQNGTLIKSGAGTLILSHAGSTGNFSFTEGPVRIAAQATAGNVALSGGSLQMDVGGATPSKLTTTGNFDVTGGTIEVTANNGNITPGTLQLVSYGGTLTGTPVVNIPPQLAASRMAPVIDYGTGTNSAITLTSTAVPLALTWQGATGGVWDNNTTANFNGGAEKFVPLDSVTFDDTGANASVLLDSIVFPGDVVFNHGTTLPTYTLSGTGGITGATKLTKNGTGTTILTTDNSYTGITDILGGVLKVGNGGLTGSLGSGAIQVATGMTLQFDRGGVAIVPNVITGAGALLSSGPGTVVLTANNDAFAGSVTVSGGTLQLGNGGETGSLGALPITVGTGATLAIRRSGIPTITNPISGGGSLAFIGGETILPAALVNSHTGGVSMSNDGHLRVAADANLGEVPSEVIPNAIRLDHGGLKNQDSATWVEATRGVTINGEAYFVAGWAKSLTIAGPITGTGNVFINYDSGRVLFNDPTSDWNGILTIGASKPGFFGTTGGILQIDTLTNGGAAGPLGMASADPANLVFNGGRLAYNGETASTDRGFTLQGAGTLEVISSATSATFGGLITGAGTLTKAGDGAVVLAGANNFTGDVFADDGVLSLTHTSSLGTTAKTLVIAGDGATLRVPEVQLSGGISPVIADLDITGAGVGSLTGALRNISGDNTLTVTNDVTMRTGNGNTTLYSDAGTLTLNTPVMAPNTPTRQLFLSGAGNGVINGVIADGATVNMPVTKNGTGTWTLNGAHTYTGTTTVNAGILSLGQAALSDSAAVTIGADGKLNLNFTGIDRVGSLTINGVPKGDGLYSAATDSSFITGTGSIRVGPEPSGYATWKAGFPFATGVNDGENDDPDFDGISNLMEYVLGGVPVGIGSNNNTVLPIQSLDATNLVLTFRRSDISESDVTLKVQWSDTLGTWNDFVTVGAGDLLPAVDVSEDVPSTDLDTVVVTIPRNTAPGGKLFVRLQATKN